MRHREKIAVLIFCLLTVLNLSGCGQTYKKLTSIELTTQKTEAAPVSLTGDWYGYWVINDATDYWKALDGKQWDCCASVTLENDSYSIIIWDEDMSKDEYLAKILYQMNQSGYSCTGGDFLDAEFDIDAVSINLRDDEGEMLKISGKYNDGATGSFYFSFYMRPWGEEWPDNGRRPSNYQEWYLPKLNDGDSMPDEINIPTLN